VGEGDVWTGEELFVTHCSACHGDFGEAVGRWPVLAGGFGTLDGEDPVKTIGSYWPYLSTVWDYVHRAMPYGAAQSLSDDEVYAITAYLLYLNNVVEDDFVLSNETFTEIVEMPNEDAFFMDDRDDGRTARILRRTLHDRLRRKHRDHHACRRSGRHARTEDDMVEEAPRPKRNRRRRARPRTGRRR
jgi:hypothetical protein